MPSQFRVVVLVPVADEATADTVTRRLQAATTIQARIGAWVMRRGRTTPFSGQVRVDFRIDAESLDEARNRALHWTRTELDRGVSLEGVGEPNYAESLS